MKLFLCSHFSSVGSLIKEEIEDRKVAFIPTASLREGYTGYVGSARKLFKKLGAIVTEIDISTGHKTQTPRVTPMQQQSQVTILLVTLILGMSQYSPCLVPANFGQA